MIQFNGVLGILAFFATVGVLALTAVICLVVHLLGGKNRAKWPKYFLFSSIILLIFDGLYYLRFLTSTTAWPQDEAKAFDHNMLFYWIPCHIAGFFLIAGAFNFIGPRKDRIDAYIEKLR